MQQPKPQTLHGELLADLGRFADSLPERLLKLGWRFRRELAPLFGGAIVLAYSYLGHRYLRADWPLAPVIGLVLTFYALRFRASRPISRAYTLVVGAAASAWGAAAWMLGPLHDQLLILLAVSSVSATIPWAWYHGRWGRVKLPFVSVKDQSENSFDDVAEEGEEVEKASQAPSVTPQPREKKRPTARQVAENIAAKNAAKQIAGAFVAAATKASLAEIAVVSTTPDPHGYTLLVERPGLTLSEALGKAGLITSHMSLRPGAIQVRQNPKRADQVFIRIAPEDPLAKAVRWPHRSITSITKPITVGIWENHSVVELILLQQHMLIAGSTGSGKSGALNSILANLVTCGDVVVWGVDLKGGIELGPWRPLMGRFTRSSAEATELLRAAVAVLEARANELGDRGAQDWEPSQQKPLLVIVIDEMARLEGEALDLLEHIASQGRAVGVQLVVATQKPSAKMLDGTELRANLTTRMCLKVLEARDVDVILGGGRQSSGWRAQELPGKGTFMLMSEDHDSPVIGRCYWVDRKDGDIDKITQQAAGSRPQLDTTSARAAQEIGQTALPVLVRERRDPVLAALEEAGAGGVSVDEIVPLVDFSRATVYSKLNQHVAAGVAEKAARGRYRLRRRVPA